MKNLMIFINPKRNFSQEWMRDGKLLWKDETETLLKIQIDNSLELGWKPEDVMLVMNFPWEYKGIKAIEVGDENYCHHSPTASKINVICALFERGLIRNDLYWFHDNDAFQMEKLDVDVNDEIALTDYGPTIFPQPDNWWSTGSIFFRNGARDIFEWIKETMDIHKANEEVALLFMYSHNRHDIRKRLKKINISYNFAIRKRDIVKLYEIADKPIKVIHFHPLDPRPAWGENGLNNLDICLGKGGRLGFPLVADRLKLIFNKHEIKA